LSSFNLFKVGMGRQPQLVYISSRVISDDVASV